MTLETKSLKMVTNFILTEKEQEAFNIVLDVLEALDQSDFIILDSNREMICTNGLIENLADILEKDIDFDFCKEVGA